MSAVLVDQFRSLGTNEFSDHSLGRVADAFSKSSAVIPTFDSPNLSRFGATISRPVFTSSRRPAPQTIVKTAAKPEPAIKSTPVAVAPEKSKFLLAGLIVSVEDAVAVIKRVSENRTWRVSVGDELEGWKVESIESDSVRLRKGATLDTVFLRGNELTEVKLRKDEEATTRRGAETPTASDMRPSARIQRGHTKKESVWDNKPGLST